MITLFHKWLTAARLLWDTQRITIWTMRLTDYSSLVLYGPKNEPVGRQITIFKGTISPSSSRGCLVAQNAEFSIDIHSDPSIIFIFSWEIYTYNHNRFKFCFKCIHGSKLKTFVINLFKIVMPLITNCDWSVLTELRKVTGVAWQRCERCEDFKGTFTLTISNGTEKRLIVIKFAINSHVNLFVFWTPAILTK